LRTGNFNIARVLNEIRVAPGISRVEIANNLQLDKSTISLIVAILLDKNLILEQEDENSGPKGGRKKILLKLNQDYGHIIGLEIQSEYYRLVVVNLESEIIYQEKGHFSFDQGQMVISIEKIIQNLINAQEGLNYIGLSIGITGIVNSSQGSILYSIPLKITEPYILSAILEKKLGIPVLIENDANCGAWAELGRKSTTQIENFIFVLMKFWDTKQREHFGKIGVGLGIAINGQVYHGQNHSAGEFKSIYSDGKATSQFAISDQELEQVPENIEYTTKLIKELSANMALLVNTLNLQKVVIGCDVSVQQDYILKMLSEAISNNWHYPFDSRYEVKFSPLSEEIVSLGAATMFLERIFELSLESNFNGIQYLKI